MTDAFDFQKLHDLLYIASKAAFISIQDAHENESFYVFALYTTGGLDYIFPTVSTEEGLTIAAQKYSKLSNYRNFSLEELRERLRWSPCDSPLHVEGEENFVDVNNLVSNIHLILDAIPIEQSLSQFDDIHNEFLGVCIKVLKQLDNEGIFGEGEKRNSAVINILKGDQSDTERLKFAKILNPGSVYSHFEQVYHA